MKKYILLSLIAALLSGSRAVVLAQNQFNYTGTIQLYTVPAGVTSLTIIAKGAQGGNVTVVAASGGLGAVMSGMYAVTPGHVLNIMVGQQPAPAQFTGGGGGGSFVWDATAGNTLLVAAGGGGGAGTQAPVNNGKDAVTSINGTGGGNGYNGGGTPGNGGTTPTGTPFGIYGAGGAGWYSNGAAGANGSSCSIAGGGTTPLGGGAGGSFGGTLFKNSNGGYGGGGGAQGDCGVAGGGGGGGYSGGAGGVEGSVLPTDYNPGGGGGSYSIGTLQTNSVGNTGNGLVLICPAPVVTSLSQYVANPGSAMTINGTNFNSTTSNNIVYFGATRASVTAASTTSVTVTVPAGATYMPVVSVENTTCAFSGYSGLPFLPSYNNSSYIPGTINFDLPVNFSTGVFPNAVIAGDLDGDGLADVVTSGFNDATISVFRNTSSIGSVSFASGMVLGAGTNDFKLKLADLDGDGLLDIVIPNRNSGSITLYRNISTIGGLAFAPAITISSNSPGSVAIGDVDHDGRPDIVASNQLNSSISVFRNTGSLGTLSFAAPVNFTTPGTPYQVAIGDLDGDGAIDIMTSNNSAANNISIFRNTSTPGAISMALRADFTVGTNPDFVGAVDLDGDGKLDVVALNFQSSNMTVFQNNSAPGSISFSTTATIPTQTRPQEFSVGDFDGDGKPDLAVTNNITSNISLFRNTSTIGTISLATGMQFAAGNGPAGAATCDFDGDGKPDLAVTNQGVNNFYVYRNDPLQPISVPGSVCPGKTITLTEAAPGGKWSSSNTNIAVVGSGSGVVTGMANGTATITYAGTASSIFTGNIVTATVTVLPPPTVTSLSTYAAAPGTAITINGTNFNSTPVNNIVFFGSVRATVNTATSTSLNVTVPNEASYMPIVSVENTSCAIAGYSEYPFLPTYNNAGYIPGTVNFAAKNDIITGTFPNHLSYGDIDGDGKTDIISMNFNDHNVTVFRNTSTIGSASFAAPVLVTSVTSPGIVGVGDIDGDGKPDIVVPDAATGNFVICQNSSTPGSISFAPAQSYTGVINAVQAVIGDIDGDGRPDVIGCGGPTLCVYRNTGTAGTISLAASKNFTMISHAVALAIGDMDGDGKTDIVTTNNVGNVSTFLNTSTPGVINLGTRQDLTSLGTNVNLVAFSDLDGDGKMDIVYTSSASNVSIIPNISSPGSLTFGSTVNIPAGASASHIAIGDFDGDSKPDISVTTVGTAEVFRNTSSIGSFSFATGVKFTMGAGAAGIDAVDFDGDGKADIATSNQNANTFSVILNNPLLPITGAGSVCPGGTLPLTDATPGGSWSTTNTTTAIVGSSSGIVTGVSYGTATITYSGTGGTAVAGNFTTTTVTVLPPPTVTSLSTYVAAPGTAVTITGANFNATPANNIVYFGATRASVTTASGTSLTVTVPDGSTYVPFVTVENTGCAIAGSAQYPFLATYNNAPYVPGTVNFVPKVDVSTPNFPNHLSYGDFDGDGKTDIVTDNFSTGNITVFRNTSTAGSVSFGAPLVIATIVSPGQPAVGDLDGDGKLDILVMGASAGTMNVMMNTSIPGSLSFAGPQVIPYLINANAAYIKDIDGDGRADVVGNAGTTVSVFLNTGTLGAISFAPRVNVTAAANISSISAGDIDGDGKSDIIVGGNSTTASLFRNTSAPGTVTFAPRQDITTAGNVMFSGLGDIDGDGKCDIIVADVSSASFSVFPNLSSPGGITLGSRLDFTTGLTPNSYSIGDFDGDGKPDVAVTNTSSASVSVYRNTSSPGTITFASKVDFGGGSQPAGLIVTDIDGDGKADLAFSNQVSNTLSVCLNNPLKPITGSVPVCPGNTIALSDATTGGKWSSSNTSVATVGSTGVVTGQAVAGGTATITYAGSAGASFAGNIVMTTVTVMPLPSITGSTNVCQSGSTILSDSPTGGTWMSGNTSIVTIGSTGIVSGILPGTATITYTGPNTCMISKTMSVVPVPVAITGTFTICQATSTTLADAAAGGIWTSSNTTVATVGSSSAIVSGASGGSTTITHSTGCGTDATHTFSVTPIPAVITGTATVCEGLMTSLTDVTPGGIWSSSNSATATVDATTGIVSGLVHGIANINYSTGCGTDATKAVTVNPLPAAITGRHYICAGATTVLSDGSIGGTWSSSNTTVATIDSNTGFVTGISAGIPAITYTLPTGCIMTGTVNVSSLPAAITGGAFMCAGSTTTLSDTTSGGRWSSDDTTLATVDPTGLVAGVAPGTVNISYTVYATPGGCSMTLPVKVNPLPSAITGTLHVCEGLATALSDSATGGTWSSGDTSLATVDSSSGILTGVSAGSPAITYILPTGCLVTGTVTVDPLPAGISGTTTVCVGLTTALSDAGSGTWSSGDTTLAKVDAGTGVVSGVSPGSPAITYTLPTGCITSTSVTVNPLPTAIIGNSVCSGLITTLTDTTSGGTWSSGNTGVATIDTFSGVVNGITAGTATVTYMLPTGCIATGLFTVNPLPSAIAGTAVVCENATTTLSDVGGGTWSSSATTIATVVSGTGDVRGVSAGTATITYTLPTGCITSASVLVNPLPVVYTVTGGGGYCAGGTGSVVGLSGSDTGFTYVLFYGLSAADTLAGTDTALTFGLQTGVGAYGVVATNNTTQCAVSMASPVSVTINTLPTVYSVTGGGNYCAGGSGVPVGLPASDTGVSYHLFKGGVAVDTVLHGTGSAVAYGPLTDTGIYTIVATNNITGCTDSMTDSATIRVLPMVTPSLTVTSDPGDTVCEGTLTTFTAHPVNEGTAPIYEWNVNGVNTGFNSPVFSYAPKNKDAVTLLLISNATCVTFPPTVLTDAKLIVDPVYVPVVSITANPIVIGKGQSDTLTATVQNAGPAPTYQWYKNGTIAAGATNATYVTLNAANKDSIACVVTGSGSCGMTGFNSLVIALAPAGVEQVASGSGVLTVLPNPNKGTFSVKGSTGTTTDEEVSLEVTDMLGQVIYKSKVTAHNGTINEQLQLRNIANGMYLLSVRSGSWNSVYHIVVEQ